MWNREKFQRMVMKSADDPGTSGGGTQDDDLENLDGESKETNRTSNDPPSGSSSPFKHPSLQGKSEDEIARIMERAGVLEATVREQGQQLNQLHRERQNPPANTAGNNSPVEEEEPNPQEFWENPIKHQRRLIREELKEIISPFKEDLARNQAANAWSTVSQQFSDLETYRPLIENILQQNGNTSPTVEDIRTVYFTAKGYVASHGGPQAFFKEGGAGAGVNNGTNNPPPSGERPPPPQHRASNQPIRSEGGEKNERRPLTETEKRWARLQGFATDAEYLDYLEQSETDVIEEV